MSSFLVDRIDQTVIFDRLGMIIAGNGFIIHDLGVVFVRGRGLGLCLHVGRGFRLIFGLGGHCLVLGHGSGFSFGLRILDGSQCHLVAEQGTGRCRRVLVGGIHSDLRWIFVASLIISDHYSNLKRIFSSSVLNNSDP